MPLMSRVHRLAMLKFVGLKIGAFFRTVLFGVEPRYGSARMRNEE